LTFFSPERCAHGNCVRSASVIRGPVIWEHLSPQTSIDSRYYIDAPLDWDASGCGRVLRNQRGRATGHDRAAHPGAPV